MKFIKFSLLFAVLLAFSSTQVLAQDSEESTQPTPVSGLNLRISPARLILESNPETPSQGTVKIANQGNQVEFLNVQFAKFKADETGSNPELTFLNENNPEDKALRSWIDLDETSFRLEPGEIKTLNFKFYPPVSAQPAHYFSLVFTRQSDSNIAQGAVISGGPALLVLNTVNSDKVAKKAQILEFKTDRKWYEFLPTKFIVRVKNEGNVHISPYGSIFIDSIFRQEVGVINLNTENSFVLPNSSREYSDTWKDGFPEIVEASEDNAAVIKDDGSREYTLSWKPDKISSFRIGRYKANLLMVYDNGNRDIPIEAETSFWVIPWKLILLALFLITLVLIGFRRVLLRLSHFRFKKKSKL